MENNIQKPLILGNYYYGDGGMAWGWWLYEHATLAIVGDNHLSPRKKIVSEITKLISSRDPNSVFTITSEASQSGDTMTMKSIPWVEDFPDPPEFYNDRQIFIDNRHFFSSAYFNLVSKVMDIPRSQLLPPISFKPHIEGPLTGYKRAIESLSSDVTYKQEMIEHLYELAEVKWVSVNEQGKKFFIDTELSLYEQALALLKAAWSFWAHTCHTEEPQQMLLVIEIPKELLRVGIDPLIEETIIKTLRILKYVSIVTTTTIILSSEMLYPAPELNLRYKLLLQTSNADLDFNDENIRNMVDPRLLQEWDRGNKNVGLWMDDVTSNEEDTRILIRIGEQSPRFWDDFVMP